MLPYFLIILTLTSGQAQGIPSQAPLAPMPTPVYGQWSNGNPATQSLTTPLPSGYPAYPTNPAQKGWRAEAEKNEGKPAREEQASGFFRAILKANKDEFCPKEKESAEAEPEQPRTAFPSPFKAPPFPTAEWQGYPNIGVPPPQDDKYSLMKGIYATPLGDFFKESRIYLYGWVTASGNFSTSKNSNFPMAYQIVPNRAELDQAVLRLERVADSVQTDHIDWGFRLTGFYGIDYRYTTGGGYGSEQLLNHNLLNGWDPLEIYAEFYIPGIFDGLNIRIGRYISPPDIEAQLAPDNYLGSHSILFAYDNYTQTGILGTVKLSNQWMVQLGINAGGDMAPWYKGAIASGFAGARWISADNKDSIYACWNSINNAKYRQFDVNGQPAGHDNYNYVVGTWSHKFTDKFITSTESYYLYEYDAPVGGTPSIGPVKPYGGGGGEGAILNGLSEAYGVLNYTSYQLTKQDYVTLRNEWYRDVRGERTGYATNYSSHTFGLSHNFNSYLQIRPELGYYRSYNVPAFDNGTRHNQVEFLVDVTYRF